MAFVREGVARGSQQSEGFDPWRASNLFVRCRMMWVSRQVGPREQGFGKAEVLLVLARTVAQPEVLQKACRLLTRTSEYTFSPHRFSWRVSNSNCRLDMDILM